MAGRQFIIDQTLAVDLGGIHPPLLGTFDMDEFAAAHDYAVLQCRRVSRRDRVIRPRYGGAPPVDDGP